ncbi:MAG: hypothetical protein GXP62_18885, partial [Oligoflexia bacterium]|nr:hypothetical protein [Oligoflexia bacterium]
GILDRDSAFVRSDPTGGEIYMSFVGDREGEFAQETSASFLEVGIRGNKYLDGNSRGKGEGSYNYVIFDDADIEIVDRFAAPISRQTKAHLERLGISVPVSTTASFLDQAQLITKWDRFQRHVSDEFIAAVNYSKAVKELGGSDPGMISALRRYFGKISARQDDLDRDHIKPIVALLSEHGVDAEQMGEYLYARHAPEANEAFHLRWKEKVQLQARRTELLAERREDGFYDRDREAELKRLDKDIKALDHIPTRLPDGVDPKRYFHEILKPSGMATSTANRKAGQLANKPGFKEIATHIDEMNRKVRDGQLRDGLITSEQHKRWGEQFKFYVPLRTEQADRPDMGVTAGLSVRGAESKMRKGRKSLADNPLTYSIVQATNAIQRGEKNLVGQAVQEFVEANAEHIEYDTGEVEFDAKGRPVLSDYQFHYKRGGVDVALTFQNQDFVDALKRVGIAHIPKYLEFLQPLMRVWRALVTSANPAFIVNNYTRDIPTALINIGSVIEASGLDKSGIRREIWFGLKHARRAVWRHARGKPISDEMRAEFDEYRLNGGQIGTFTSPDFTVQQEQIEKRISRASRGKLWQMAEGTWAVVEDANQAIETATRFSAYRALRRRGMSAKDAALAARQLTVDFSQRVDLDLLRLFLSIGRGHAAGHRGTLA